MAKLIAFAPTALANLARFQSSITLQAVIKGNTLLPFMGDASKGSAMWAEVVTGDTYKAVVKAEDGTESTQDFVINAGEEVRLVLYNDSTKFGYEGDKEVESFSQALALKIYKAVIQGTVLPGDWVNTKTGVCSRKVKVSSITLVDEFEAVQTDEEALAEELGEAIGEDGAPF